MQCIQSGDHETDRQTKTVPGAEAPATTSMAKYNSSTACWSTDVARCLSPGSLSQTRRNKPKTRRLIQRP